MSISVETALKQVGFVNIKKKANTLQGIVFKALNKFTNKNIVIKTCNKSLHKNKIAAVQSGEKYVAVKEDIISEAAITKYITESEGVPKSIAKFYDFFQCNHNYYLVMEDAGDDLFDFVVKAHRLIQMGTIDIFEWHKVVKVILKQMIEAIEFIHSKNVCHLDISLENFLINDVEINCFKRENKTKMQFVLENIKIKLIDFGLAEKFNEKDNFTSTKWCGKSVYKSPEIISKIAFDAKSNDVWCTGVSLWMLIFGCCPWNKASVNDELFVLIMNGCVVDVLTQWNKMNYVNRQLIDLFATFFQYQDERKCLDQIKQHPWLQ
eukprot:78700_1